MANPAQHRRLLSAAMVAEKLGYSRPWLSSNLERLQRAGFPRPVLEADEFGGARWDEKAIDLWLDARMDPALRKHDRQIITPMPAKDLAEKLRSRARYIAAQEAIA